MIGTLEYRGWHREWLLRCGDGTARDIRKDFWTVARALKGRPASLAYGRDDASIGADPNSEFDLQFEDEGSGLVVSKRDGFGFSNVLAYFDMTLQKLIARRVEVAIAADRFEIAARDEPGTPGVYYTARGGNFAAVPPGWERSVCRIGEGKAACIFLVAWAGGFECAKFDGPTGRMLLDRHAAGPMNAGRIGNCRIMGRLECGDA